MRRRMRTGARRHDESLDHLCPWSFALPLVPCPESLVRDATYLRLHVRLACTLRYVPRTLVHSAPTHVTSPASPATRPLLWNGARYHIERREYEGGRMSSSVEPSRHDISFPGETVSTASSDAGSVAAAHLYGLHSGRHGISTAHAGPSAVAWSKNRESSAVRRSDAQRCRRDALAPLAPPPNGACTARPCLPGLTDKDTIYLRPADWPGRRPVDPRLPGRVRCAAQDPGDTTTHCAAAPRPLQHFRLTNIDETTYRVPASWLESTA